jgi:hypothetical protein
MAIRQPAGRFRLLLTVAVQAAADDVRLSSSRACDGRVGGGAVRGNGLPDTGRGNPPIGRGADSRQLLLDKKLGYLPTRMDAAGGPRRPFVWKGRDQQTKRRT